MSLKLIVLQNQLDTYCTSVKHLLRKAPQPTNKHCDTLVANMYKLSMNGSMDVGDDDAILPPFLPPLPFESAFRYKRMVVHGRGRTESRKCLTESFVPHFFPFILFVTISIVVATWTSLSVLQLPPNLPSVIVATNTASPIFQRDDGCHVPDVLRNEEFTHPIQTRTWRSHKWQRWRCPRH